MCHIQTGAPPSTDPDEMKFYLWTRDNHDVEDIILYGDVDSVNKSHIDFNKQTRLFVHGYTSNGYSEWIYQAKNATLEKGTRKSY